jgi:hypothetical protein
MTEPTYFDRNAGGFSCAMASGFSVRFALAHLGEDIDKVRKQYWAENPRPDNPSSELALCVLWCDLPPRRELMVDEPIAAQPRLLPDAEQRGDRPRRKYVKRKLKPAAAIAPPIQEGV